MFNSFAIHFKVVAVWNSNSRASLPRISALHFRFDSRAINHPAKGGEKGQMEIRTEQDWIRTVWPHGAQASRRPRKVTGPSRQPSKFPQFPRKIPQRQSLILPNIAADCYKLLGEKKVPGTHAARPEVYLRLSAVHPRLKIAPPLRMKEAAPFPPFPHVPTVPAFVDQTPQSCLVVPDRTWGEARPRLPASKTQTHVPQQPSNPVKPSQTTSTEGRARQFCLNSQLSTPQLLNSQLFRPFAPIPTLAEGYTRPNARTDRIKENILLESRNHGL